MQILRAICISAILASVPTSADSAPSPGEWVVGSKWRITISDDGKPEQTVTVRVEADRAKSCLGGDWKLLKRVSGNYSGLSEPAYMLSDDRVQILLASDICDRYDHLDGSVKDGRFSGSHSLFGIEGGIPLGKATAVRVK